MNVEDRHSFQLFTTLSSKSASLTTVFLFPSFPFSSFMSNFQTDNSSSFPLTDFYIQSEVRESCKFDDGRQRHRAHLGRFPTWMSLQNVRWLFKGEGSADTAVATLRHCCGVKVLSPQGPP